MAALFCRRSAVDQHAGCPRSQVRKEWWLKRVAQYAVVFIVTAFILIAALVGVAKIPRESIYKNVEKSALYLQKKQGAFPITTLGLLCSSADYYADGVLLCIAYNLDPSRPAESVAWSRFYTKDRYDYNGFVKKYFPASVLKHLPANQQYLRYWHGSIAIVRPLLLLWDLTGMLHFLTAVLIALMIWLSLLLTRNGMKGEAIAFGVSMAAVSIWFVPLCLEYIWMFLCMTGASILIIKLSLRDQYKHFGRIFLVIGMIAVFLDFFTTETITLLIPLLFAMRIRNRREIRDGNWKLCLSCSVLWGIGYVGMWVMKWIFASAVLGMNVMPYVNSSISEHLGVDGRMSMPVLWVLSITRCFNKLFPFSYKLPGKITMILLIIVFIVYPVYTNRVELRTQIRKDMVKLYLTLGMIPFVRFLVISFHTYEHSWFVYRALAATVLALCFTIMEIVVKKEPEPVS